MIDIESLHNHDFNKRPVQIRPEDQDYGFIKEFPYYMSFIILEYVIQWLKRKPGARLNDSIVSFSHGMYYTFSKFLVRGTEVYIYTLIYSNWRVIDLPWDSSLTWYLTALGVDFGFYWVHRASHEINFLWGAHQVHHSSEEFNLTTSMRHSWVQGCLEWIIYLPLALILPTHLFLIHQQFNLMYQFWVHASCIGNLGPLEYILNTPIHHKVHHGSNSYCLDSNYGGILIIWDRIFGTFAQEKKGEKIIFGLVDHPYSFNPFWLQFYYYPRMWTRISGYYSLGHKLSVIFKGPAWEPGKPRLGDPSEHQLFPVREIYDVEIPVWQNIYTCLHFGVIAYIFGLLLQHNLVVNQFYLLGTMIYIFCSLSSLGFILEQRKNLSLLEFLRCIFSLFAVSILNLQLFERTIFLTFFGVSTLIWILVIFSRDRLL